MTQKEIRVIPHQPCIASSFGPGHLLSVPYVFASVRSLSSHLYIIGLIWLLAATGRMRLNELNGNREAMPKEPTVRSQEQFTKEAIIV